MRTDTIFYRVFQIFPGLLFELIGKSASLGKQYQFSSREVKELARRFDGVSEPKGKGASKLPIYFTEVQFQARADFYWRLFTEIFLYLGQYSRKLLAVSSQQSAKVLPSKAMYARFVAVPLIGSAISKKMT